ncbi:M48 family metallopeptidase [Noviherbaspirillum sp.]|uniref:M48 family metallopeptidase n=1 Tax=Noviherbaspirillum sp. TaxID=1926288 RepID=UPI002FE0DE8F
MNRFLSMAVIAATFTCVLPAQAAKESVSPDGVKVEKMSRLRTLVPESELNAAAGQQYAELLQQAKQKGVLVPESHPQVQRLRAIAERIIPEAKRWNESAPGWKWEVNLINTEDINAFCMPGGKIAFFSGILNKLKLTDDEAAIVMGHEAAHALREHSRERLAKSGITNVGASVLGFGLSALFGIDPNVTNTVAEAGASLAILKFSRSDETEADLVGLDIAARAGYDPRAGITLWRKMGMVSKNGPPQWLSTHPAGTARIAQMEKHMAQVMPLYAKAKGVPLKSLPPYESNVKGIPPVK